MNIRQLREADHGPVVAVVDDWWGGRRVADKLPRLFFRYFAETSFAVEGDGELVAFLVGIVGSPADEAYVLPGSGPAAIRPVLSTLTIAASLDWKAV